MAGGGGRTQKNKAHKTRFASKSSRHAHKAEKGKGRVASHPASVSQAARALRLQRNKDVRDKKRAQVLAEKRASHGVSSPPRILALVALSSEVELEVLRNRLLLACSHDEIGSSDGMDISCDKQEAAKLIISAVAVPRLKVRFTIIYASSEDLQAILEVAKVADVVAFVTTAAGEEHGGFIGSTGKKVLSMFRAQGFSSSLGFILGLDTVSVKKRAETKKMAVAALQRELSEDSKIFPTDNINDCLQVVRHLAEQRLSPPLWRSQRPYIVTQQIHFTPDSPEKGTLSLSGYVRGRGLSVNQLVHVAGVGDFQIKSIDIMDDPCPLRGGQKVAESSQAASMLVDKAIRSLVPNPELRELLIVANVPDPMSGEQTWPTENELAKVGKAEKQTRKKRVPKGTSKYQASWILDEVSDEEVEDDAEKMDVEMDGAGEIEDAEEDDNEEDDDDQSVLSEDHVSKGQQSSVWDEEDGQSEMMDEEELSTAQRNAELQRLKAARPVDEEFPDDVDTPTDVPARERFAKYRGLKSFRTSPWDPKESLPLDYARIFSFKNFNRTRAYIAKLAAEVDKGDTSECVGVGTFIQLHISDVPSGPAGFALASASSSPVVACGLLKHESKMSVLHFSLKKSDGHTSTIRSKDELIFHTGFRRFTTRPIFSADTLNADKHKFERYLSAGQFVVATVYAPVTIPPMPVIIFKAASEGTVDMVASGALKTVDPDRIILKKIVLSGYPHRVQKRKAVVRFMFHNPEDVRWFKPVELWSKYGRRGRIKEAVGTHGSMKCIFDGVIQQRDSVCLSLYKRVYPPWPQQPKISM